MEKISQDNKKDQIKKKVTQYKTKKIEVKHILIVAAVILFAAAFLKNFFGSDDAEGITELVRPPIGEEFREYMLDISYGGKKYQLNVDIGEKTYDATEMEQLFDAAQTEILELIRGENEDIYHVNKNMKLIDSLEGFNMDVYWLTDSDYINYWGEISDVEKPQEVVLAAKLKYRGLVTKGTKNQRDLEIPIVIYPKEYTSEEKVENDIRSLIEREDILNPLSDSVELPEHYEGQNILYSRQKEKPPYIVFILLPAAGILALFTKKEKGKEAKQKIVKQMETEYPDVLLKLSILVGAGMTTFNAMRCITEDYEHLLEKGMPRKPGYEEIRSVVNKVNSGIPEWKVYSEMGKTAGVHCFIKLGALLVQNVTKGNDCLRSALDIEMKESFKTRKTNALILGEKAGTKLLAPMIMMLMVVLTIIMVPAFMSF